MKIEPPISFENFLEITKSNKAVCFYLSTPECNVCKVLKPKVIDMIENDFTEINFCYVDLSEAKKYLDSYLSFLFQQYLSILKARKQFVHRAMCILKNCTTRLNDIIK